MVLLLSANLFFAARRVAIYKAQALDLGLLGWLLFQYAYQVSDLLPSSQWGDEGQINGTVATALPTPSSPIKAPH